MTREDYIAALTASPWRFPAVEDFDDPPPEWAAEAWEIRIVQEAIAGEMSRQVSKTGSLPWNTDSLAKMSAVLSTEQVVRLFEHIRDRSPHREAEFRPGFEQNFQAHAPFLPTPLTRAQVTAQLHLNEESTRQVLGEDESG